jgi:hypothetical protein
MRVSFLGGESTNHNGDSKGVLQQAKGGVRPYVASTTGHQHMRYSEFVDGELSTSYKVKIQT